jgi:peptidoglycan/xylan/chitin deacetylase (PgdA/CDA1 family)
MGIWAGPLLSLALRLGRRRAGLVLLYHTIDRRQGDPSRELVPPLERSRFLRQLRHLRRFYEVVSIDELLPAVARRRRGQRFPVCVTFDDDARQHFEQAMPALAQEHVPATFFLCGAGLNGPGPTCTWWERLQRAFDRGCSGAQVAALLPGPAAELDPSALDIHRIEAAVKALPPDERNRFSERLIELAGEDPPGAALTPEEIRLLSASGHTIGFHTRRHDPLPQLDAPDLDVALNEGRRELVQLSGSPIETIAYPHGQADARVAKAARRAGFQLGFTTAQHAVTPTTDPLLLGRFEPMSRPQSAWRSQGAFALGLVRTLLISQDPIQGSGRLE